MKILDLINKKTSLQIFVTLLAKKEIEYTTKECLLSQMPFKCDRATFRRHIINLLDSGLLVCEHYETYKIIKLADPSIAPPTPEKPIQPTLINNTDLKPIKSSTSTVIQHDYEDILNQWNTFAENHKLSTIIKLNDKRKAAINARFKEPQFVVDKILSAIEKNDFLLGINDINWKVTFDYIFCSPNNWLKILENSYPEGNKKNYSNLNSRDQKHAQFTQNMKELSQ